MVVCQCVSSKLKRSFQNLIQSISSSAEGLIAFFFSFYYLVQDGHSHLIISIDYLNEYKCVTLSLNK